MKLVVVSDSHSLREPLDRVLEEHADADYFLHCGDICLSPETYPQFKTVCGNNDYYDYPYEIILNLGKHRLIMFHSHLFSFMKREEKMIKKAKSEGCDIVLFGHTHVAFYEYRDGVHVLNPGSIYHARDGRPPSYAIMNIGENDDVSVEFIFLKK